ncbi:MAG: cytochrome P450 [Myxococcales bacterium]|jgi:sterol 14-demethylase
MEHSQQASGARPTPPLVSGRWPVIGHAVDFARDRERLLRRGYAEHGSVFALDLAGKKIAVVTGAEHNRTVYTRTDHELNPSKPYEAVRNALGEVLFLADRQTYLNQRPITKAIFNRNRMPAYLEAMNAEVQRWLDGLPDGAERDITAEMVELTQAVAGHAFIGPDFRDELGPEFWEDYGAIAAAIDFLLPQWLPVSKFRRRDRAKARLKRTMSELIARRRAHRDRYEDLITLMMETPQKDGTPMSETHMCEMLVGLLFAGHETTAGQAAWAIIALAKHPQVLARARDEVERHVPEDLEITPAILRQLEYTYRVVDETTRLFPSADMQARTVDAEIDLGPYRVPVGWQIFVNAANSHHLASDFADADVFDPSRFERGEGKNPWQIVGFGGGGHKCSGMNFARNEIAIILARVLAQFEAELLTPETRVLHGLGANRPTPTRMRLTRRAARPRAA